MATEVTQRQRAEAVVDTVKAELPPIWLGGRQRMVLVDEITQALTTARQEALREARLAVDGEMCDEPDHACGSLQRILDDIDRLEPWEANQVVLSRGRRME